MSWVTVSDLMKTKQKTKQTKFNTPKVKGAPTTKRKTATPTSITGKFVGNRGGFGFVEQSHGADLFIPPHLTLGALNGDNVVVKLGKIEPPREPGGPERQTGTITGIIKRDPMVGTFFTQHTQGFIKPLDNKIPYVFAVAPKTIARFGLVDGHRVVFSVDKKHRPDEGIVGCFITDVLGHINDVGMDVLTMVISAGVPYEFSNDVIEEANVLPASIDENDPDIAQRLDLRNERIVTIDGADTKDIDDAISFKKTDNGYTLGVHIADVTHYVKEHSELDTSALDRGTSIYLADRVIPMLPHKLSSGICSLFPEVDRFTLSCIMNVDKQGNVTDYQIKESIINSKRKWTYDEVQALIGGTFENNDKLHDVHDINEWASFFQDMDELRAILWNKREKRGALDFNLPETKISVDENGKVVDIKAYERNQATNLIEEFMILTNETIAAHYMDAKIPFVYRTHEAPTPEKIASLSDITQGFGFTVPKNASKPAALQKLLEVTKNTDAEFAIANAVLHALPQAHYTMDDPQHYGLASEAYCHFTSPIRRYPDLQIHRIIKANLRNGTKENKHFSQILPDVCTHCSRSERTAEQLERDVTQLKKVQFMMDHEGTKYEAQVSGVTSWGVFVVVNKVIEGLVPIEDLRAHRYTFNADKLCYENKKFKNMPTLSHGVPVVVTLTKANIDERKLTFALS